MIQKSNIFHVLRHLSTDFLCCRIILSAVLEINNSDTWAQHSVGNVLKALKNKETLSRRFRTIFSLHCRKDDYFACLVLRFSGKGNIIHNCKQDAYFEGTLQIPFLSIIAAVIVIVSNYFSKVFASFHEFCCDDGSVDMSPWSDVDNYRIAKQSSRLPYLSGILM